jgi:PadR family transcriptional regulator PadR
MPKRPGARPRNGSRTRDFDARIVIGLTHQTLFANVVSKPKNLRLRPFSGTHMESDLDLVRGTLDLLVMKTLSWGPMHGLGVVRWIEQTTHDELQIEEGALYPALHRMEKKGWLNAEWGYTEKNRKAKFYRLSACGRKQLTSELTRWSRYTNVVGLVLAATSAGGTAR